MGLVVYLISVARLLCGQQMKLKTFNLCDTGPLHGESAGRQTSRFSEQRVSYVEGPCYIT